jgi:hypothetical protein
MGGRWAARRHPAAPLGAFSRRLGLEAVSAQVAAALAERWAPGPEPADELAVSIS